MKFKIYYNTLVTYLNNKKRKKLLEILNNQLGGSTNSFDNDSDNEETKDNSLKFKKSKRNNQFEEFDIGTNLFEEEEKKKELINKLKHELTCPISLKIMIDPVSGSDGITYERNSIIEWLNINQLSPFSKQRMTIRDLVPNRSLKNFIEFTIDKGILDFEATKEYLDNNPNRNNNELINIIKNKINNKNVNLFEIPDKYKIPFIESITFDYQNFENKTTKNILLKLKDRKLLMSQNQFYNKKGNNNLQNNELQDLIIKLNNSDVKNDVITSINGIRNNRFRSVMKNDAQRPVVPYIVIDMGLYKGNLCELIIHSKNGIYQTSLYYKYSQRGNSKINDFNYSSYKEFSNISDLVEEIINIHNNINRQTQNMNRIIIGGSSSTSNLTSSSSKLKFSFNDLIFPVNMKGVKKVFHLNMINQLQNEKKIEDYLNEFNIKIRDDSVNNSKSSSSSNKDLLQDEFTIGEPNYKSSSTSSTSSTSYEKLLKSISPEKLTLDEFKIDKPNDESYYIKQLNEREPHLTDINLNELNILLNLNKNDDEEIKNILLDKLFSENFDELIKEELVKDKLLPFINIKDVNYFPNYDDSYDTSSFISNSNYSIESFFIKEIRVKNKYISNKKDVIIQRHILLKLYNNKYLLISQKKSHLVDSDQNFEEGFRKIYFDLNNLPNYRNIVREDFRIGRLFKEHFGFFSTMGNDFAILNINFNKDQDIFFNGEDLGIKNIPQYRRYSHAQEKMLIEKASEILYGVIEIGEINNEIIINSFNENINELYTNIKVIDKNFNKKFYDNEDNIEELKNILFQEIFSINKNEPLFKEGIESKIIINN